MTGTREQLLAATSALMIERGSIDISLNDIATHAKLNSALVKYYFGNKSGLLVALLDRALSPSMTQLEHLLELQMPPEDKMRIHISGMINTYYRHPYAVQLMNHLILEDPDAHGRMIADKFGARVLAAHTAMIADGHSAGSFRSVDPLWFYFQVVGTCDQLFSGRYLLKHLAGVLEIDEMTKRSYSEYVTDMLLNGLRAARPSIA